MPNSIAGYYEKFENGEGLIEKLKSLGIDEKKVSVLAYDPSDEKGPDIKMIERGGPKSPKKGAALGGAAGFLAGIAALAVPGVGPVVVAGPLFSGLIGAAAGASAGALYSALKSAGIPEEEVKEYSEGIKSGGTLVVVEVDDDKVEAVSEALHKHGPVDISQRKRGEGGPGGLPYDPKSPSAKEKRRGVRRYVAVR